MPVPASTIDPCAAVRLQHVSKIYGRGDNAVTALRDVSVELPHGSFTAVMGPSGSGKSTFLHVAAGLDRPTSGEVFVGDLALGGLDETSRTKLRRDRIGFVFQTYNLVPSLTVKQNVGLPSRLAGRRPDRARVREVLARVGLTGRANHRPAELSGGQQQRTAIARAAVMRPDVLFADEPTGALDSRSGTDILQLLRQSVDEWHQTVVMVTHDPHAAAYADSVLYLSDGRVVDESVDPSVSTIAHQLTTWGG
jgi:putative ABC transport system ATP-binding protein